MAKANQNSWAAGPSEILEHGIGLLKKDTDTNRRLAMIIIDNSVELMIKTYLALPKRITGLKIPRKKYQEISESFPSLLDALEEYAADKLYGIDLGAIEWYHRLRNELYHQGIGLTIERDKVVVYSELGKILFKNLFGAPVFEEKKGGIDLLGKFVELWIRLDNAITDAASRHSLLGTTSPRFVDKARFLSVAGLMSKTEFEELSKLRKLRNDVFHGSIDYKRAVTKDVVKRLKALLEMYNEDQDG